MNHNLLERKILSRAIPSLKHLQRIDISTNIDLSIFRSLQLLKSLETLKIIFSPDDIIQNEKIHSCFPYLKDLRLRVRRGTKQATQKELPLIIQVDQWITKELDGLHELPCIRGIKGYSLIISSIFWSLSEPLFKILLIPFSYYKSLESLRLSFLAKMLIDFKVNPCQLCQISANAKQRESLVTDHIEEAQTINKNWVRIYRFKENALRRDEENIISRTGDCFPWNPLEGRGLRHVYILVRYV